MTMKTVTYVVGMAAILFTCAAAADPDKDASEFREHFNKRFPGLELNAYADGVYAIDEGARQEWQMIEEFPPYEPYVERGRGMWAETFANGASYSTCFEQGPGVAHTYPRWDQSRGEVVTLPMAVNECRTEHGEKPLPLMRGPLASLLAYMTFESRGKPTAVERPETPEAVAAYEQGRAYFEGRRGQLNMSCAQCHFQNAGAKIRSDIISPALGHTTGWPVYRSAWGELGTLHRRFAGCNAMTRARVYAPQSETYRNLEYFLTYMSNDIEINGPSARK